VSGDVFDVDAHGQRPAVSPPRRRTAGSSHPVSPESAAGRQRHA
jgi:hypothetical protein